MSLNLNDSRIGWWCSNCFLHKSLATTTLCTSYTNYSHYSST